LNDQLVSSLETLMDALNLSTKDQQILLGSQAGIQTYKALTLLKSDPQQLSRLRTVNQRLQKYASEYEGKVKKNVNMDAFNGLRSFVNLSNYLTERGCPQMSPAEMEAAIAATTVNETFEQYKQRQDGKKAEARNAKTKEKEERKAQEAEKQAVKESAEQPSGEKQSMASRWMKSLQSTTSKVSERTASLFRKSSGKDEEKSESQEWVALKASDLQDFTQDDLLDTYEVLIAQYAEEGESKDQQGMQQITTDIATVLGLVKPDQLSAEQMARYEALNKDYQAKVEAYGQTSQSKLDAAKARLEAIRSRSKK